MPLAKVAGDAYRYRRPCLHFASARAAFKAWLRAARLEPGQEVLLPAYVGWSPREGSGVFDPIAELRLPYRFYGLGGRLEIDLASLESAFRAGRARVLVMIHYFGHPDPRAAEAADLARRHGALVLEDEAHAMLSDLVGGACGRHGNAAIFSLHKLLPVPGGGSLVFNDPLDPRIERLEERTDERVAFGFDLAAIAARRRSNYALVHRLLGAASDRIEPLWGPLPDGEVPQTYPVLVPPGTRDKLYHALNERGFGVVSLYHTLIEQIPRDRFTVTARLSERILNLPVHQDVDADEYEPMVEALAGCLARFEER